MSRIWLFAFIYLSILIMFANDFSKFHYSDICYLTYLMFQKDCCSFCNNIPAWWHSTKTIRKRCHIAKQGLDPPNKLIFNVFYLRKSKTRVTFRKCDVILISRMTPNFLNYEKYKNPMNFEQFFDDVISGHIDTIDCWFFTASKVLGWSLIISKVWGHPTYQYYVTFSESDPSFRFSQMKKSWKMDLFDRFKPCFRVSRYRWIR